MIQSVIGDTDGVLRWTLVELDHHGVAVAIVDNDRVDKLWDNIVPVNGIDVHSVAVDGEFKMLKAAGIDEGERRPAAVLLGVDRDLGHLAGRRGTALIGIVGNGVDVEGEVTLRGGEIGRQATFVCELGGLDGSEQGQEGRSCVCCDLVTGQAVGATKAVDEDGISTGIVDIASLLDFVEGVAVVLAEVGEEDGLQSFVCCGELFLDRRVVANGGPRTFGRIFRLDDYSTVEAIHDLPLVVGMIEVDA